LPSVIILVADGARPDTFAAALDSGALPALARLRREGGLHTVASVFPSVTGPAYVPFLFGCHPAPAGLVGLRWLDRARTTCSFPDYTRSYVGYGGLALPGDVDAAVPSLFELAPTAVGAQEVIGRGLRPSGCVGREARMRVRTALTHFRGDVAGWLDIDREIARRFVAAVGARRPAVAFAALAGVDKVSHAEGHDAPRIGEALAIVDETVAALRADAEADGRWEHTHLWVVSDHGHSPVRHHEDLAAVVEATGRRTIAHPRVWRRGAAAAVMVSGNAMAHIYLDLADRTPPGWRALARRHESLVAELLARPSVDVALLPSGAGRCEVRARGRGTAHVEWRAGKFRYLPASGDPLGLGALAARGWCSADEAYAAAGEGDYPDVLAQVAAIADAPRSGDVILSAARDWDFRARYEPIPHVSSHGALHREHMLVPLLLNRPAAGQPRRTVDVMPSALRALGLEVPPTVVGRSFLAAPRVRAPARAGRRLSAPGASRGGG
jgi:hypothetical protein